MKEKLKLCVAALIFIFFLPYLVTMMMQRGETEVPKLTEEKDRHLEQLTGILAKEISMESEPEAMKAQAIIARTNLCRSENVENVAAPEAFSGEELAEIWGEAYPEYMEKVQKAISETANQVLVQEGTLIDAAFHSVSGGRTRSAAEVPGQEDKGWLVSVDSAADIRSADYITVIFFDKEALMQKTETLFSSKEESQKEAEGAQTGEIQMSADEWVSELKITGRDSAGYVTGISCGGMTVSGEEIRNALELPSACFYIAESEGQMRVLVKGQGHGFGLSQHGANELAKEGKSCEEILHYYYSDVELETYP